MVGAPPNGNDPDFLPMGMGNMGFHIDRLHRDCSEWQFIRELTQNSIDSIRRLKKPVGEISWDADWFRHDLEGIVKLAIIDNGIGMTGEDMCEYINKLSSSIHPQSRTGNFGVGAKIAAAPLNPEGLVYLSWQNNVGYVTHLYKSGEGDYGLMRQKGGEYWGKLDNSLSREMKPEGIGEHGTMVVLLGQDKKQNTMSHLRGDTWLVKYLNSRYFRFPDGISVKVREGWKLPKTDRHRFMREAKGAEHFLIEHSRFHGSLELSEARATAHWWILQEGAENESGRHLTKGYVAALYKNEIYNLHDRTGGSAYAKLQQFGVIFGCDRVVILIEPDIHSQVVESNTSRSDLLIDGGYLDWSLYAEEFRKKMPEEIRSFLDGIAREHGDSSYEKAMKDRLKSVWDFMKFRHYRRSSDGKKSITISTPEEGDISTDIGGGNSGNGSGANRENRGSSRSRGKKKEDIYAIFTEQGEDNADSSDDPIYPNVEWISLENGKRSEDDLKDRAARYLYDTNTLFINEDFLGFVDMKRYWLGQYPNTPGAEATISNVVREWFEQQLVEVIMSAHALRENNRHWSLEETKNLWSEVTLTALVLARYHINIMIKRSLVHTLGRNRDA